MTGLEKLELVVNAAADKKAVDLTVLDLAGLTLVADYFVLCCGTSNVHIRTIADSVLEATKAEGMIGVRAEGYKDAKWVCMDFGDVVVHVMDPEQRAYYDLEGFWSEAVNVDITSMLDPS